MQYIGKTRDFLVTTSTTIKDVDASRTLKVNDVIEGVKVGAIRCSFHWRDAIHGGEQFMWRGRWACQAGKSREEIENAIGNDGEKRFAYIHVGPVSLGAE